MDFKYNEKLYGETLFNNGFQTDYFNSELTILVKYLKEIKEYKRKDTEEFLYDFCKKYIEGFNEVKYFKVIDRAIVKGRKRDNKLMVIENISIYKKELEEIDKLNIEHEYKKLLLAFLISKKISLKIRESHDESINEMSAYFEGDRKRYNDIFKTANIVGKYKVDSMIYELVNKKILESVINGGIILKYIYPIYDTRKETYKVKNKETDELEDKEKSIIVYNVDDYEIYEKITDFDNVGYIFDYYKKENGIKKCEFCGKFFKPKNKKATTVKNCSEECSKASNKKKTLEKYYENKQ